MIDIDVGKSNDYSLFLNEIFVEIQKVIKIEQYGQGLPMLNGKKSLRLK